MKSTSIAGSRWLHGALCLFLLLIGFPSGCSQDLPPADFSGKTPLVRVLLLQNQSTITITATQPPTVRLASEVSTRHVDISASTSIQLTHTAQGWVLGSATLADNELTLLPATEGSVFINGHAYRGRYRFASHSPTTFDVINDVDVEGYLKGVVAKEMLPDFLPEAYKAQAVVARTYALYVSQMRSPGSRFDLYGDDRDQVYGGISGESAKSRQAVDETHGMVVVYGPPNEEKIFKAYFSSCCGGIGQSAADAFGDPASEPLSAQAVGSLCSESPRYSWPTVIVTKTELTRRLKLYGQKHNRPEKDMAALLRIDISSINNLGRPVRFITTDIRGRRFNYTGEEIRQAVNTDIPANMPHTKLFSSLFQLKNDGISVSFFNGHGLGHGVGMCQWCAQRRAEMGLPFSEIVLDSYPKSKMVTAY